MYQVTKDGALLALVDEPIFIRMQDNGCFGQTTQDKAQGIAIQSTPYNLLGREPMREDLPTVMCVSVDGGVYLSQEQEKLKENADDTDEMLVDQEVRIAMLEMEVE